MKCTVLAGADGATKAVGLLDTDSVFLVVNRTRPVYNHSLFPCERCQVLPMVYPSKRCQVLPVVFSIDQTPLLILLWALLFLIK